MKEKKYCLICDRIHDLEIIREYEDDNGNKITVYECEITKITWDSSKVKND